MSEDEGRGSERRIFRRTELASQVEIEVPPEDAQQDPSLATGVIVNLGLGGILARVDTELAEGTLCTVRFLDPHSDEEMCEARGFVRRSRSSLDGKLLVGIEFEARMDALRRPPQGEWAVCGPNGRKVLVVDDEPSIVELLYRFLTRRGCEVTTAGGGEEALARLREGPQDMMLLDLRMPGLDGLGVLQRMRDENLEVGQIWAISGYVTDSEAREALRLGAADFINKPLDLKYLEWSMQLYQATL